MTARGRCGVKRSFRATSLNEPGRLEALGEVAKLAQDPRGANLDRLEELAEHQDARVAFEARNTIIDVAFGRSPVPPVWRQ